MYYTVIKHNGYLRTRGKCRKHDPWASVFKFVTVAVAISELRACAGGILLRGIILHWSGCSLRVVVYFLIEGIL